MALLGVGVDGSISSSSASELDMASSGVPVSSNCPETTTIPVRVPSLMRAGGGESGDQC